MNTFSKKEALSFGWHTFWQNWKLFVGLSILTFILSFLPSYISDNFSGSNGLLTFIFWLIFWILQVGVGIGVIKIYLLVTDNQPAGFNNLFFATFGLLLKYIVTSFLYGVIIVAGFILLIIPGIIFSLKLQFWPWIMIDKGYGIMDSLKESWRITKGVKLNLLLLSLLLTLVNFVGLLCLGVGLLVTGAVTQLATSFVYRKLETIS